MFLRKKKLESPEYSIFFLLTLLEIRLFVLAFWIEPKSHDFLLFPISFSSFENKALNRLENVV